MKAINLGLALLASFAASATIPAWAQTVPATTSSFLSIDWEDSDKMIYLTPVTARSCYLQYDPNGTDRPDDVLENVFALRNFSLTWTDPETDLYIDSIKLIVQDRHFKDGQLEITIEGNELASIDGSYGSWMKSVLHASSPHSPSQFVTQCSLLFGGIAPVIDEYFEFKGVIEVTGFSHNYDGTDTPVKVQKEISLTYFTYYNYSSSRNNQ